MHRHAVLVRPAVRAGALAALALVLVGTVMAAVVGTALPTGAWDPATVLAFVHSQQISFVLLAVLVVVLAAVGLRTLTDSRQTEEH